MQLNSTTESNPYHPKTVVIATMNTSYVYTITLLGLGSNIKYFIPTSFRSKAEVEAFK